MTIRTGRFKANLGQIQIRQPLELQGFKPQSRAVFAGRSKLFLEEKSRIPFRNNKIAR
jgi:hypothetical protein